MAMTESRMVAWQPGDLVVYKTGANAAVAGGALVCVAGATGDLIPADDAANLRFVGVALEPGAAGGASVRVRKTGVVSVVFAPASGASGALRADIGKTVYALSDDTVALDTTQDVPVGVIVGVEQAGASVRVRVDGAVR